MMQLMRFSNGGFVIHKIVGQFKGRASAWFDAAGKLLDCEQYPQGPCGPTRAIKRDGPIWRELESVGRVNAK